MTTETQQLAEKFGAYLSILNGKINFAPEQLTALIAHVRQEARDEYQKELSNEQQSNPYDHANDSFHGLFRRD